MRRIPARLPAIGSSVAGVDAARCRSQLDADPFATSLGVRLVEAGDDRLVLEMAVTEAHLNFMGVTHGGAVFGLADVALALATNSERTAVAVDAHIVYSGGSRADDVLRVEVVGAAGGRRLATHRATVTRGDGRVVALFTGTVYNRD